MVDTEVLDWDEQGRGKRVRLFVDAKVRKVDYTLDYRYDQPDRIEWDFVEGNGINDADGHYLFEDLGDGRTRATYKLGLEVGIPLPGPVARRAHKSTLKGSVEDLKREAERRAASAAQARAEEPTAGGRGEAEREARLAEQVGIKRPERPPPPTRRPSRPTTTGALMELTPSPSCPAGGRRGRIDWPSSRRWRRPHRAGSFRGGCERRPWRGAPRGGRRA